MGDAYYSLDAGKVISSLGSDRAKGLSESVASERLKDFGLNEIKRESSVKWFTIFLRQFKSFIIYILIFALIFSIIVSEYIDAWVIFAILMLNALCREILLFWRREIKCLLMAVCLKVILFLV